jgi:hypothetical protein
MCLELHKPQWNLRVLLGTEYSVGTGVTRASLDEPAFEAFHHSYGCSRYLDGTQPWLLKPSPPILTESSAEPSANAELPGVAWVHQFRTSRRSGGMTFTEYAVALGGMLASLAGVGLLAAGLIKAKARH